MAVSSSTSPLDSLRTDILQSFLFLEDEAPSESYSEMDDEVFGLACYIYTIAKEKQCFQSLAFVSKITNMAVLANSLVARGVKIFLAEDQKLLIFKMPELTDMRIPWPILHLFCRFEYLSLRGKMGSGQAISKEFLFDCFKAEERFPQNKGIVSIIVDCYRFAEVQQSFNAFIKPVIAPIDHWTRTENKTSYGFEAIQGAMVAKKIYCAAMESFSARSETATLRPEKVRSSSARIVSKLAACSSKTGVVALEDVRSSETDGSEERMKEFVAANLVFAGAITRAVKQFGSDMLPKLGPAYSELYVRLEQESSRRCIKIDQLVLQAIPQHSLDRFVPYAKDQESLPPLIAQVLKGFDVRVLPSPEEFSRPLQEIPSFSLTEEFKKQYDLQKSQPSVKPGFRLDFLPLHLQKLLAQAPKTQQASAAGSKRGSAQHQKPAGPINAKKSGSLSLPIDRHFSSCSAEQHEEKDLLHSQVQEDQLSPPPSIPSLKVSPLSDSSLDKKELPVHQRCTPMELDIPVSCASPASLSIALSESPPLPLKADRKDSSQSSREVSEKLCCAAPCSSTTPALAAQMDSSFSVHVGDGPDHSLLYSDRVGRWTDSQRDVFQEDKIYRLKTYSKSLKEEIVFRHSFGRALVSVILKEGRRFERAGMRGVSPCTHYTLPGDITKPDGNYEKVVFTVSVNQQTQEIFHVYATQKTPMTIKSEYAKNGFFAADEEEEAPKSAVGDRRCVNHRKAHPLPDDGSRVVEVSSEYISVRQADGTMLNVYPFPDII